MPTIAFILFLKDQLIVACNGKAILFARVNDQDRTIATKQICRVDFRQLLWLLSIVFLGWRYVGHQSWPTYRTVLEGITIDKHLKFCGSTYRYFGEAIVCQSKVGYLHPIYSSGYGIFE